MEKESPVGRIGSTGVVERGVQRNEGLIGTLMSGCQESGQIAAMKVLDFIKECGAAEIDIILKIDQEPAIEALMADEVKTRGAAITVLEKPPVGSIGSNACR